MASSILLKVSFGDSELCAKCLQYKHPRSLCCAQLPRQAVQLSHIYQAPVNELVKGFRQVISDESFWKEVDSKTLKQLVEGDANIDAHQLVENVEFTTNWKEDQKQLVLKTLHSLGHGTERVPSFQKTLNKMFRHFTGSYKAPPVGNFPRLTFVLMRNETMPHGNDTNASVACKHIYVEKGPRKIFINEVGRDGVPPRKCCDSSRSKDLTMVEQMNHNI